MKKLFKRILPIALASVITCTSFGCSGQIVDNYDENKDQIFIRVYNGGTGVDWIKDMAKTWSDGNENYEVIILDDSKPTSQDIIQEAGTTYTEGAAHAWMSSDPGFKTGIESGLFEDLSDILTKTAQGDSKTIGQKLQEGHYNYSQWQKIASDKNGQGMYMLPYTDSMIGLVYDHDYFVQKGWLYYAEASEIENVIADGVACEVKNGVLVATAKSDYYEIDDRILRAGKDGKYGTYDDGQPETEAEFNTLVLKIKNTSGHSVFIWNGENTDYLSMIALPVLAQWGGLDDYETFLDYDSNGQQMLMHDGSSVAININNGYKVFQSEALYKAYEFVGKYMGDPTNLHPVATQAGKTPQDAQGSYLWGIRGIQSNPQAGFLVDGAWWENEAAKGANNLFKQNVNAGYPERDYGMVDYRYMLLPEFEGQKGIDGQGNGSVCAAGNAGAVLVRKFSDKNLVDATKDFILYTLSDANLVKFTQETSEIRPYAYSMTDEQKAQMTPFARAYWDLRNDKQNVEFICPWTDKSIQPVNYASSNTVWKVTFMPTKINGMVSYQIQQSIEKQNGDYEKAFKAFYYTESLWTQYVNEAKNNGFYK